MGQTTNILFDLMLGGLFKLLGPEAAQRISVSLAVLIFVWGAFAFVRRGFRPSAVADSCPSIAMLAYGWVYHMGFFNFYLSLGLCFWALALVWNPSPRRLAAAVPILGVAYPAHALPVVWAAALAVYMFLASRISPRWRAYIIAGSLLAMVIVHVAAGSLMAARWYPQQIALTTGLDQVWVFDGKY